jgi:hypothetical protein
LFKCSFFFFYDFNFAIIIFLRSNFHFFFISFFFYLNLIYYLFLFNLFVLHFHHSHFFIFFIYNLNSFYSLFLIILFIAVHFFYSITFNFFSHLIKYSCTSLLFLKLFLLSLSKSHALHIAEKFFLIYFFSTQVAISLTSSNQFGSVDSNFAFLNLFIVAKAFTYDF